MFGESVRVAQRLNSKDLRPNAGSCGIEAFAANGEGNVLFANPFAASPIASCLQPL
jgi:hypothetical protein